VAAQRNVDEYKRRLLTQWEELPPIFVTSSERGSGRDELLAYIEDVNADVAAAKAEE
jgi:GTP-binding protein